MLGAVPSFGPWEVAGEIGRGSMGRVFRVRHRDSGEVRAVKVLDAAADDDEALERFERESQALLRLGGGGVVRVHEVGRTGTVPYYVMDLLTGGTLRTRLRARKRFVWREAADLVARLARTLERCHAAGILHRDLKPENVLFDEHGAPAIADFGLARDLRRSSLSSTGMTAGTPGYMAPEQVDFKRATEASDVFALGVILYELTTGVPPYRAQSPLDYLDRARKGTRARPGELAQVPSELEKVIDAALESDPARRTATAAELARALEALTGGAPARGRAPLLALAATALAFVGVWLATGSGRPATANPPAAPATPASRAAALARARDELTARRPEAALAALATLPETRHKLERALAATAALTSRLAIYIDRGGDEPLRDFALARDAIEAVDRDLGRPVARRGVGVLMDGIARRLLRDRLFVTDDPGHREVAVAARISALGPIAPLDPIGAAAVLDRDRELAPLADRDEAIAAGLALLETDPLTGGMLVAGACRSIKSYRAVDHAGVLDAVHRAIAAASALRFEELTDDALIVRRVLCWLRLGEHDLEVELAYRASDAGERVERWRRARSAQMTSRSLDDHDYPPSWSETTRLDLVLGDLAAARIDVTKAEPRDRVLLGLDIDRRAGSPEVVYRKALAYADELTRRTANDPEEANANAEQANATLALAVLAALDAHLEGEARETFARVKETGEGSPTHRFILDWDAHAIARRLHAE
jgi:hypothetical protein